MNLSYYRKINNTFQSKSKQETERWLVNRNETRWLYDNIDAENVLKNEEPFELLVIKGTSDRYKKIKSKHDMPFNLGDYIKYNGKVYLVTSLDPDDKTHHSGTMTICMYVLRWQKKDGSIVERWAATEDFTKYDSGQIANGSITIASNQYGLIVPIDNETKMLPRDKRFVMDVIDKIDVDNGAIPDTYMLTNEKPILNDYRYFGRGGTITFTTKFDSFNKETDKWVDGYGWICDYFEPQFPIDDPPEIRSEIKSTIVGSDTIKDRKRTWKVEFKDSNDEDILFDDFEWIVDESFVTIVDGGNNDLFIGLKCSKDDVGKNFNINIVQKSTNTILSTMNIEVIAM